MTTALTRVAAKVAKNPRKIAQFVGRIIKDPQCFLMAVPVKTFKELWAVAIRELGYYDSFAQIDLHITNYIRSLGGWKNDQKQEILMSRLQTYIVPHIICYQLNPLQDFNEIIRRTKQLKKALRLDEIVCGSIINFFQDLRGQSALVSSEGGLNNMLGQILDIFGITQAQVDYTLDIISNLYQLVGDTLFDYLSGNLDEDCIERELYLNSRDKMPCLMARMKKRPFLLGDILAEITTTDNNLTKEMKIANTFILFLLFEYWNRLPKNSQFHEQQIEATLAEAFHRQLYLLYDSDRQIVDIMLAMLGSQYINRYEKIAEKVSYHLLARMKLFSVIGNENSVRMVECICRMQSKNVNFYDNYLQWCPQFITNSQKQVKSRQEDKQNFGSQAFQRQSYSKQKQFKHTTLRKTWKADILDELKKFNLERLYLVLEGFRKYIVTQWKSKDERPHSVILGVVINVLRKIEEKKKYRVECDILMQAIRWELNQIMDLCQIDKFSYMEASVDLGLYDLCSIQLTKGTEISIEQIVKMHCNFNFQLDLSIFLRLKYLSTSIRTNEAMKQHEQCQKYLNSDNFQDRLYRLFKKEHKANKILEGKLTEVAYLLSMRNEDITKNIFVNYASIFFEKNDLNKLIMQNDAFSELINEEVRRGQHLGIIEVILKMITIFEDFERYGKPPSLAKNYFNFLKRVEHKDYYLKYAEFYQKFNYIKEAIFFTELYCWNVQSIDQQIKKNLASLYSKVDLDFQNNLHHIQNRLGIKLEDQRELMLAQHSLIERRMDVAFLHIREYFIRHKFSTFFCRDSEEVISLLNWVHTYEPVLDRLVVQISQFREAETVKQKLLLFAILKTMLRMEQYRMIDKKMPSQIIGQTIRYIEEIKNNELQLVLYKRLINNDSAFKDFPEIQEAYLQLLLTLKQGDIFQDYIKQKESHPNFGQKYLPYVIKEHYLNQRYIKVMHMVNQFFLKGAGKSLSPAVHQMYLESRYKAELDFDLLTCLRYFHQNCAVPNQAAGSLDKHFSYSFKMFRMMFERYPFTKTRHNQKLLQAFLHFITVNKITSKNKQYLKDTIFYLLRFVLQKFYYDRSCQNYGLEVIDKLRENLKDFVPFCDYLLRKVSQNEIRNGVIQTILRQVLLSNTNDCIWTIAFLRSFEIRSKSKSNGKQTRSSDPQTNAIIQFYSQLWRHIESKTVLNAEHLKYISFLTSCGKNYVQSQRKEMVNKLKKIPPPGELSFPFMADHDIQETKQANILGNGKSTPLLVKYLLKDRKKSTHKFVTIIIKEVNSNIRKYRLQSKCANFFEECSLIDKRTTYRIFHISRDIVMIQYVQNIGTILSITNRLGDLEFMLQQAQIKVSNPPLLSNGKQDMRSLMRFDYLNKYLKIKFSQFMINRSSSVKDWWRKYTNFVKTCAQWSMVGYLVGLGDRHPDNILLTDDCKVVHIDFQYVNDAGLRLPYPEWMPFRLTNCLVEPLGCLAQYGLFYSEMIKVGKAVQKKEAEVWRALSNFVGSSDNLITQEIISRSRFEHYNFNSIEEGIAALIITCRDPQLLRSMFRGWSAHL